MHITRYSVFNFVRKIGCEKNLEWVPRLLSKEKKCNRVVDSEGGVP